MTERFEVQLRKAVHVFAAGHFITLTDDLCEPVHGHNWTVGVDVAGEPDAHGMVVMGKLCPLLGGKLSLR